MQDMEYRNPQKDEDTITNENGRQMSNDSHERKINNQKLLETKYTMRL